MKKIIIIHQRQLLILLLSIFILYSCGSSPAEKKTSEKADSGIVKVNSRQGVIPDSSHLVSTRDSIKITNPTNVNPGNKTVVVSPIQSSPGKVAMIIFKGQIFSISNYCGGAAPSQEMMEQARKPKPISGMKFFLRPGGENESIPPEISFTTDGAGKFSISIPAGQWCLLAKEQALTAELHSELYNHPVKLTNENEYKKWWKSCLFSFTNSGKLTVEKNLTFQVNCMTNSICPYVINPNAMRMP